MGADVCRAGWVGIVLDGARVRAYCAGTIRELVDAAGHDGELDVVGIDIPIGLPDRGRRQADVLARRWVGPRRAASVFLTPVRSALVAADHAEAVRVNRALAGEGVSAQAYGLRDRILEVDDWLAHAPVRVVEVHPEVSFAAMAGAPLAEGKKSWAGAQRRRALLAGHGVEVPADLGPAGALAAVDDVLDAAAAAWSARRVATGSARLLPDPPERFSDGRPCAIAV
jgi:predicted RNase H-like nuclease